MSSQQFMSQNTTTTLTTTTTAHSTPHHHHHHQQQQPPSFNEISKFFHLPLSDAASNLGTCTSVLKKVCLDNGLERWPYRKILAGKSVDDIKRYAAREKHRKIVRLSNLGKQSGLQQQKNDSSKSQGIAANQSVPEQGIRSVQIVRPQSWPNTSLKGNTTLDEFKYGFPSDVLSVASNKWWGSSSPDDCEEICQEGADSEEEKEQNVQMTEDGSSSVLSGRGKAENEKGKIGTSSKGATLLTTLRKRTIDEGREALKLGVHRGSGVHKLGRKERNLLFQIFGSSLPNHWIGGSS